MSDRPQVTIRPQTANCIEVYIDDTRIVACKCEGETSVMIEGNGQEIKVTQNG